MNEYANTEFQQQLSILGACPEARHWVGNMTFAEAWTKTDQRTWMTWLLSRMEMMTCICRDETDTECPFCLNIDEMRQEFPQDLVYEKLVEFTNKMRLAIG